MSLAEGMLQLIENALLHANGGLLSIRIREYVYGDEDNVDGDTKFLRQKYSTYFQKRAKQNERNTQNQMGKMFYMEAKLSDISEKNMKAQFLYNIEARANKQSESIDASGKLQKCLDNHRRVFETNERVFDLFFDPSELENDFWREYYKISENRVHHFGLQIFDSVLQSKGGALCACGHGNVYNKESLLIPDSSEDNKIYGELDTNISGTSYRILLPLSHEDISNNNVIVDTSADMLMSREQLALFRFSDGVSIRQLFVDRINWDKVKSGEREKLVENIAEEIKDKCCKEDCLIVVAFDRLLKQAKKAEVPVSEEVLTKSALLFLLRQESPQPFAIVGLTPHSLLEVTRIIALFYDKEGETTDEMKKIQIYLKGENIGEEILFAGSNINQTADRITRLALTRGSSAEYISIAQSLLIR